MNHPSASVKPQSYYENLICWPLIIIFILINIYVTFVVYRHGLELYHLLSYFVTIFVLMNYYSVQVSVRHGELAVTYGIGLVKSATPLSIVDQTNVVSNTNLKTWFFNPRGDQALRISIRGGGSLTIPSSDPKVLLEKMRFRV